MQHHPPSGPFSQYPSASPLDLTRSPPKGIHDRSKNIVDPLATLTMGVHQVDDKGGL